MKVPEQPGKSSRSAPEMLEEILSLVRSIDKATSPSLYAGSVTGTADWAKQSPKKETTDEPTLPIHAKMHLTGTTPLIP